MGVNNPIIVKNDKIIPNNALLNPTSTGIDEEKYKSINRCININPKIILAKEVAFENSI